MRSAVAAKNNMSRSFTGHLQKLRQLLVESRLPTRQKNGVFRKIISLDYRGESFAVHKKRLFCPSDAERTKKIALLRNDEIKEHQLLLQSQSEVQSLLQSQSDEQLFEYSAQEPKEDIEAESQAILLIALMS